MKLLRFVPSKYTVLARILLMDRKISYANVAYAEGSVSQLSASAAEDAVGQEK